MLQINKVCIGIQARSTSHRFPGKVHEMIGGRSILDHVISVCLKSAGYLNRYTYNNHTLVKVALLVPEGDSIIDLYRQRVPVIAGDEFDVLSRYQKMATEYDADYIVRITADCPRIPEFIISKHISIATKNHYDYFSNVHEGMRTAPDGFDCEVISRKALEWLSYNAKEKYDKEHVTTLLRNNPQSWMHRGINVGHNDLHALKLSIDTQEDLDLASSDHAAVEKIEADALTTYGKSNVHHF